MDLLINWLIALAVLALLFVGLYIVVRAAVRDGMKEALLEVGREVAKKVWDEDGQSAPRS